MSLFRKIKTFIFLDNIKKILFVEAFVFLAWARILKSMQFSKIAPLLGKHMDETSFEHKASDQMILRNVSDAIYITSNYTFWESKCLVKAIAGMKMLQRRKIESTLYLGTAKDEKGIMIAHAWLRSGALYITGAEEMRRFTIVGKFAKRLSDNR
ncbi:lasso peptide biosynthesis B2 protein [Bacillus sp. ISL-40]|uniref:lasso peptide biosynthesis B2 protein n=1 Tax=unclassified Bacillus (in: firmicutes) TaxID=185979 RepID=UPI001BE85668|nr:MULTISPECIES: lasso peptide biosynthesis B2 protein [unclassified Bacillus (in: firmicutes)]MBT2699471.1 lasso peptide biosynthesis B2 protein [Bacillus sp. ISL-40]MBT2722002.1 lasso peptide biosynthesis B2 protein [Bacillus sp. ISL-46]MBT2741650.1 lasso peptide biosynthesis B2 protein [Bacillus sp. ISL-77]